MCREAYRKQKWHARLKAYLLRITRQIALTRQHLIAKHRPSADSVRCRSGRINEPVPQRSHPFPVLSEVNFLDHGNEQHRLLARFVVRHPSMPLLEVWGGSPTSLA